jgi:hypothetical protein
MERDQRTWLGWERPFPWLGCAIASALIGLVVAPVVGFLAITNFDCCDWHT